MIARLLFVLAAGIFFCLGVHVITDPDWVMFASTLVAAGLAVWGWEWRPIR